MNRERGLALVLTAVLGTVAFAIWALSFRATLDTVRTERWLVKRAQRDGGVARALSTGIARLRTGTPKGQQSLYLLTVGKGGDAVDFVVTYTKKSKKRWTVEARVATALEAATLPVLPDLFGL